MPNIEHKDLTDPELHEPKGIAGAIANTVYVADGSGTGTWSKIVPDNVVVVHSVSDLPAAVGGVITLAANTIYLIVGTISLSSSVISIPNTSGLIGTNPFIDKITSASSSPLLTISNNCVISNLGFSHSAGDFIDVNDTASYDILITNCVVEQCNKIGSVDAPGNFVMKDCNIKNASSATGGGLDFTGVGSKITLSNNIFVATKGPILNLDQTTAPTFNEIFIGFNYIRNPSGETGIAIEATEANLPGATDRGFIVDNYFLTVANDITGYAGTETKWVVRRHS